MAKEPKSEASAPETVISIIGPGMRVVGDCETDGTVRIEGQLEGSVKAGKAVVVGKDGEVDGTVDTQDAVISGKVAGTVTAESRLELQATARIDGDIYARRMQLEEGALVNGNVHMGELPEDRPTGGVGGTARSSGAAGERSDVAKEHAGKPGEDEAGAPEDEAGDEEDEGEGGGFGFSRHSSESRPSQG